VSLCRREGNTKEGRRTAVRAPKENDEVSGGILWVEKQDVPGKPRSCATECVRAIFGNAGGVVPSGRGI